MAKQGTGAALVVLGLVAAGVALASSSTDGQHGPFIEGGKVVLRGWKSNAAGIRVEFQVEEVPGPNPDGTFFGVVREPWNDGNPMLVAQAQTRQAAAQASSVHIAFDTHGLP